MKSRLFEKDLDSGKDWGQEEKGATKDEMVGWHRWLNGTEFEQTLGGSEEQGSLVWCSPWGCRVGHDLATEQQYQKNIDFHILFHYGLPLAIEYSSLCYTTELYFLFILYILVCNCWSQTPNPSLPLPLGSQVSALCLWRCLVHHYQLTVEIVHLPLLLSKWKLKRPTTDSPKTRVIPSTRPQLDN